MKEKKKKQDLDIKHFLQYGNIIEYVLLSTTILVLLIKYETRKDAESAQMKSKLFQDRSLLITSHNLPHKYIDTNHNKAGWTLHGCLRRR